MVRRNEEDTTRKDRTFWFTSSGRNPSGRAAADRN